MLSFFKKIDIAISNGYQNFGIHFFKTISYFLRIVNPTINYKIYSKMARIPFCHNLPNILAKNKIYSYNLKRIVDLCYSEYESFSIIDVGANIGDTVLLLDIQNEYPILCIEGDLSYFRLLKENTKKNNVKCLNILISENQNDKLRIKTKNGTGSTENSHGINNRIDSLDNILFNHENSFFLEAKLIKIDTDGYDIKVLKSARKYLMKTKPIIFAEYDPYFLKKNGEVPIYMFRFLKELGYDNTIVYDNLGYFVMTIKTNE